MERVEGVTTFGYSFLPVLDVNSFSKCFFVNIFPLSEITLDVLHSLIFIFVHYSARKEPDW